MARNPAKRLKLIRSEKLGKRLLSAPKDSVWGKPRTLVFGISRGRLSLEEIRESGSHKKEKLEGGYGDLMVQEVI